MSIDQSTELKTTPTETEQAVRERYSAAADAAEAALCCPVVYDPQYLKMIPDEIIEKDYGCGDPSPFVNPGETIVDLGSGGGKLCYIAAQIVGAEGKVIGVDCNFEMLSLARKYKSQMAEKLGYDVVDFRCGRIQDLSLNLELLEEQLSDSPIDSASQWLHMRSAEQQLRETKPLIESDTVDCVVSNCVLNLVRSEDRRQLFQEIYRVLRNGGRAAISDIVCDEDVPESMQKDANLWSGCISGAWREDEFLKQFEEAGFYGIEIAKREEQPWQTINGIEFRSVTVVAHKGKEGPCLERNQSVVYKGPFKSILDDDGHRYPRGQRMAVCDKTYQILKRSPYSNHFCFIEPHEQIPLEKAQEFDCSRDRVRHARESKGENYQLTIQNADDCCGTDGCC